jgi:hypothetical protein
LEELNALFERTKTEQLVKRQPVATYDFILPKKQYAVFYSEPLPKSKYDACVFVRTAGVQVDFFSIVQSYPTLHVILPPDQAPIPYELVVGFKLKTDPGVTFVLASTINVTAVGSGVILSIPTDEKEVVYSVYMEIQSHL